MHQPSRGTEGMLVMRMGSNNSRVTAGNVYRLDSGGGIRDDNGRRMVPALRYKSIWKEIKEEEKEVYHFHNWSGDQHRVYDIATEAGHLKILLKFKRSSITTYLAGLGGVFNLTGDERHEISGAILHVFGRERKEEKEGEVEVKKEDGVEILTIENFDYTNLALMVENDANLYTAMGALITSVRERVNTKKSDIEKTLKRMARTFLRENKVELPCNAKGLFTEGVYVYAAHIFWGDTHLDSRERSTLGWFLKRSNLPPLNKGDDETTEEKANIIMQINAITIEKKVFINNEDSALMSEDELYEFIIAAEREIKGLGAIENKPASLSARIKERKGQIKALIALMDSRDGGKKNKQK